MAAEVWITGVGLVSSLGEGAEAHWQALAGPVPPQPVVEREAFAPHLVHPMTALELDRQIPKKADQRQMEAWQRLGTYAAGLALADAGLAGDLERLAATDMIVAAGGGERDTDVDGQILAGMESATNPGAYLNERLGSDLRPTLFLAQLSNLLAGNISIVHKVTGSSRTFMGEEMAGVSAVEVGWRRLAAGQGTTCLVGAAFNAERKDMVLNAALGGLLWTGEPVPVWERVAAGGGMLLGSAGAFLVLETRESAEARGAKAYARLGPVLSERSRRAPGEAAANAAAELEAIRPHIGGRSTAIVSGALGPKAATEEERRWLEGLIADGTVAAVRAPASLIGAPQDATFPALVALAAIALRRGGFFRPFDGSGLERDLADAPEALIVTCWGQWRGEGMALLTRAEGALEAQERKEAAS